MAADGLRFTQGYANSPVWPARIGAGGVSEQHCRTMDWSATLLDAAGVRPHTDHPLDGQSLLPLLQDPGKTMHRPMFWCMKHRGQRAHRDGQCKYLRVDDHDDLFDITQDERERANHGRLQPQRLQGLRQAWSETMSPVPENTTVSLGNSVKDTPQR